VGDVAYAVYEKDDKNQLLCEFFGQDKNSAINYLKSRGAAIGQELKSWVKETGINRYIWRKDNHYRDIYLKVVKVGETNEE
jgi:hypothetical protein